MEEHIVIGIVDSKLGKDRQYSGSLRRIGITGDNLEGIMKNSLKYIKCIIHLNKYDDRIQSQ